MITDVHHPLPSDASPAALLARIGGDPAVGLLTASVTRIVSQLKSLSEWLLQTTRPRRPLPLEQSVAAGDDLSIELSKVRTTGWAREDLLALSAALSQANSAMSRLARRLLAFEEHLDVLEANELIGHLEEAVCVVGLLVRKLGEPPDLPDALPLMDRLGKAHEEIEQRLEAIAITSARELKISAHELAEQELSEAFAEVAEQTEQVGHLIFALLLKSS